MAKIGITGTHGTGKTTLLKLLKETKDLAGYNVCDEITRTLADKGFPINEAGNDKTQLAIMDAHTDNLKHENLLTDRTAIDGYVYSAWLEFNGKITNETLLKTHKQFIDLIDQYDIIFYIKPEFQLEDDGVRSTNQEFEAGISRLFASVIEQNKDRIKQLVEVSGTPEERLKLALKAIRALKNKKNRKAKK